MVRLTTGMASHLATCRPAPPSPPSPGVRTWFDGAVHSLDGYLRPGCVHLTVQARLGFSKAARGTAVAAAELPSSFLPVLTAVVPAPLLLLHRPC